MPRGSSRPLVFAHRGASATLPEHTLQAYELALAQGVDGLECDVRLTRDGHLVCLHDARLERTSNGSGRVSAHRLAELDGLDFTSWHPGAATATGTGTAATGTGTAATGAESATETPVRDRGGGVLTLDRLLDVASGAGRPVRLLVETKHPTRYGGAVERRLVALLRRHGLPDPAAPVQVTAMSFAPLALRRLRYLMPSLPTVLLLDILPRGVPPGWLAFGARIVGPGIALVRTHPELVQRLQERGYQVYVWTVNDPADVELVRRVGVDGVISDRPAEVLAQLDA